MSNAARPLALSMLLALTFVSTRAPAQVQTELRSWGSIPVDSGARLRITTRDGSVEEGRLLGRSGTVLTVSRPERGGDVAEIRTSDITRVEVRASSRRTLKGAGMGLLAGVVTGLALGAIECASASEYCGLGLVLAPPMLGGAGTIAGAIVGSAIQRESWRTLEPNVYPQRR